MSVRQVRILADIAVFSAKSAMSARSVRFPPKIALFSLFPPIFGGASVGILTDLAENGRDRRDLAGKSERSVRSVGILTDLTDLVENGRDR